MKLKILVDLDDTMWDLVGHWVFVLNHTYGTTVQPSDIKTWDIASYFPTLTRDQVFQPLSAEGFWAGVRPIHGSQQWLGQLYGDGHEIYVVTATSYQSCFKEKMSHLLELYPFLDWGHVIVAKDKSMIRGDIQIDDAPFNLSSGLDPIPILFHRPHNADFDHISNDIIRLDSWAEIVEFVQNYLNLLDDISRVQMKRRMMN